MTILLKHFLAATILFASLLANDTANGNQEPTVQNEPAETDEAQTSQRRPTGRRGGGFGGPIELGPDDVAAYDAPPEGFKTERDDGPHGKL